MLLYNYLHNPMCTYTNWRFQSKSFSSNKLIIITISHNRVSQIIVVYILNKLRANYALTGRDCITGYQLVEHSSCLSLAENALLGKTTTHIHNHKHFMENVEPFMYIAHETSDTNHILFQHYIYTYIHTYVCFF